MIVRHLGREEYVAVWRRMRAFCDAADSRTADEIWLLEHPPVYTLGQAGRAEDLLRDNGIPLVRSDRGGQITYHGPGQVVVYLMLDLRRRGLGARALVQKMQQAAEDMLADYGIAAKGGCSAPGVYVGEKKIAAVGLRVRRGRTYHGMSLNVEMDLSPFADIHPCGFRGLRAAQMSDFVSPPPTLQEAQTALAACLQARLASSD